MAEPLAFTDSPLSTALPELMSRDAISFRALAARSRRIDDDGRGLTAGHLANLASGHDHPSRRALELLAACFDLEAQYFPEHRLAELREAIDERRVGFPAAYRTYERLTSG